MIDFNEKDVALFRSLVEGASRIALISHTNADGDAIGSMLATKRIVGTRTGVPVCCVLPSPLPGMFSMLPGYNDVLVDTVCHADCEKALMEADLIVALDLNNAGRVDNLGQALVASHAHKVLIDHHHSPDRELFHLLFSIPEFSSTCELAFWLFSAMFGHECIDRPTATCLYTGIGTDTGFFAYSCSSPSVYEAAARLVATGIDPAAIHDTIHNCFSIDRMRFYGFAISERLRILPDHKAAYFYISLDDQRRFGMAPSDLEGLVNYTLMMSEIEVGAMIREEPGRVKASFRAKGDYDVSRLARDLFGGGGHTKAAGSTSTLSFDATVALIDQELRKLTRNKQDF